MVQLVISRVTGLEPRSWQSSTVGKTHCDIHFSPVYQVDITLVFLYVVGMLNPNRPIEAFWDPFVHGSCIPIRIVVLIPASLNSVTEFVVFLRPARTLWKVRQPPLQRFGLIFVFVIGC